MATWRVTLAYAPWALGPRGRDLRIISNFFRSFLHFLLPNAPPHAPHFGFSQLRARSLASIHYARFPDMDRSHHFYRRFHFDVRGCLLRLIVALRSHTIPWLLHFGSVELLFVQRRCAFLLFTPILVNLISSTRAARFKKNKLYCHVIS
jgi:hypothetical protein